MLPPPGVGVHSAAHPVWALGVVLVRQDPVGQRQGPLQRLPLAVPFLGSRAETGHQLIGPGHDLPQMGHPMGQALAILQSAVAVRMAAASASSSATRWGAQRRRASKSRWRT